jgi:hypothetical protein
LLGEVLAGGAFAFGAFAGADFTGTDLEAGGLALMGTDLADFTDFADTMDFTGAFLEAGTGWDFTVLGACLDGFAAGAILVSLTGFVRALAGFAFGLGTGFLAGFTTGFDLDLGEDLVTGLEAFLGEGLALGAGLDFGAGLGFDLAMTGVFWGGLLKKSKKVMRAPD